MVKKGRPTKYTEKLGDKLCSQLSLGKSLRTVCKNDDSLPDVSTIFNWFRLFPDFLKQYEKAKEESADFMSDEMQEIADTVNTSNPQEVQKARLRIDTRKWLASKLKPKRYGDKLDMTSGGEKIQSNIIVFSNFENEAEDK